MPNWRQEVLNVTLAQVLQQRGVIAAPESILRADANANRQMPDVLVHYQGMRLAIEGEVEAPNAHNKALASAQHRVETGVGQIGIAVVYPKKLREVEFVNLPTEMPRVSLDIAVVTEAGSSGFVTGDIDSLERTLRSTFEQLVQEDVVAEAVSLLDTAVEMFTQAVLPYRGLWGRIAWALGVPQTEQSLNQLTVAQRGANCRIAGLVLMNAMIFHGVLADKQLELADFQKLLGKSAYDLIEIFDQNWQYILDQINYYSIFHLAREVLLSLSLTATDVPRTLTFMVQTAHKISEKRAALRHDLMGRVYHRLLTDAKYLGTYYTSIPAATLLLKLALRPQDWQTVQWDNAEQVAQLRIADLACGTGTLLMASADAVLDNYVSAAAGHSLPVDLVAIHQHIAESILHGYDVLPSAIHLTASTLAMRSPDVPFKKMNLFSLPLGGADRQLGSLEFLSGNLVQIPLDLSGLFVESPEQVTGSGPEKVKYISVPDLDLCVINPPFVRSVGGNLLFGSVPEADRNKMQTRLKKLVRDGHVPASITSGLGSVFVAIADRHIKPGGRLALVLPKALLSGVSWTITRRLINRNYRLDYLIVSHDPEHWNFSDSTDLSEVLLIATKRTNTLPDEPPAKSKRAKDKSANEPPVNGHGVTIVNLWHNPTTTLEALAMAARVSEAQSPQLFTGQGAIHLDLYGKKAGEAVSVPWKDLQADWFLPCAFAQSDLTRSAYSLINGELHLPGVAHAAPIKTCALKALGTLGPDRRDIYDAFEMLAAPTAFPSFWGHNAKEVLTMTQAPNKYLSPLPRARPKRHLRQVTDLWPKAGSILLAERMWLKTQRLVALRLDERVLSNVWWSFSFDKDIAMENADKVLVLWLNCTLGLLIYLATRDETRGAWVDFKKPSLGAMPVLDVRALTEKQIKTLAAAYDRLSNKTLKPLPDMAKDKVRAAIDSALADALGLPDFSVLRTLLAREPVVCMKGLA
ncbi:MAG: DNA methyltransferase family protein [Aggregatilineales bacterium]